MLHASSVKAFKTLSDKNEASEDEDEKKDWAALKPFIGSMMGLDFKNISDTFWRDFEYQAKQIYEGLFEVLKCGRKTDKIDKKALEAIFVVVLGEDKVPVKDRLKHVFDAFDHNGDGDFKMDEMTPFIHAIFDLIEAAALEHFVPVGVRIQGHELLHQPLGCLLVPTLAKQVR